MHITSVISERLIQLSENNKHYPLNVPFLLPNKQTEIVNIYMLNIQIQRNTILYLYLII